MQQIDDLRLEIKSFEFEIQKLQQELSANSQIAPKAVSNSPEAIAAAFRSAAVATTERIADVQGIRGAIAELTDRLQPKKIQLGELEAQELKQHRLKRIEEGKKKLRAKFTDVEKMAESLQSFYFELKAITSQYETDFATIHPPTNSGAVLNRNSLLNFGLLMVPELLENDGRFLVKSKPFDVFKSEKEALRRERIEASRRSRQNHEDMVAQLKQREVDEKMRTEREYRASLLSTKQLELSGFKSARADRLASLKTANVSDFDNAIASLEAEITALEAA
ncbi:MAG: hypothetical protein H0U45_07750 [Tatlockia sp.]|nr:hypothetical protein [Tatlockia sp.]